LAAELIFVIDNMSGCSPCAFLAREIATKSTPSIARAAKEGVSDAQLSMAAISSARSNT